jgi:hypothetical protein
MDLQRLREEALQETARYFQDQGFLPDQDSDEWEDAYRRQFELLKKRHAAEPQATTKAGKTAPPADIVDERPSALPPLSGAPAEARWAGVIRAERLKQIPSKEARIWVEGAWTGAKEWLEMRDLPPASFLRRVEIGHAEHRRRTAEQASALAAEQKAKAEIVAAHQRRLKEARITVPGLIELVDASERVAAAPHKLKLAELAANGRTLRIFESTNPRVLVVLEKNETGRLDYAIERDDGLVADLKLYAEGAAL